MTLPTMKLDSRQSENRLTDRQYAAIGRVAAHWAEAEFAMGRILNRLALIPSLLGYVLTDIIGVDNRIKSIGILVKIHKTKYRGVLIDSALLAEIEASIKVLARLKDDRNLIVHAAWVKAGDLHMTRLDFDPSAPSIRIGFSERLSDIEKIATEIEKVSDSLEALGVRLPGIDAALLSKLTELDQRSHRAPARQSTHQSQRQSCLKSLQVPLSHPKKVRKRKAV